MPPRYAYWTILVDEQPTAFRAGAKEDLMPTFNRLKAKNDTAKMMWFQLGKLWPSRLDAQEFMRARGEMGRKGDERQAGRSSFGDRGGFRDRKPAGSRFGDRDRKPAGARSAWTPRGEPSTPPPARNADDKLDWKPKGEFVPAPKRSEKPDWKPKGELTPERPQARSPQARKPWGSAKPAWKPKGEFTPQSRSPQARKPWASDDRERKPRSFARPAFKPSGDDTRSAKPEWKPKGSFTPEARRPADRKPWASEKPAWKSKPSFDRGSKPDWKSKPSGDRDRKPWSSEKPRSSSFKPRTEKLEWSPKSESGPRSPSPQDPRTSGSEKRKWVPKEEYKKSMGIEAKRDAKWRPGGLHKDPKQKYKDAKKAKWTKFKKNIRTKWEAKGKKKGDD